MTEMDDLARARLKRCTKEMEADREALQEAIRDCAIATLQYENLFDFASSVICTAIGKGFAMAEELVDQDLEHVGHDEIHAMAGGLVRKMINDVRDSIELEHDPECPNSEPTDESS